MDVIKQIELLKEQNAKLEQMYKKDTEELIRERDLWKNRALEAETQKVQSQRKLRHV